MILLDYGLECIVHGQSEFIEQNQVINGILRERPHNNNTPLKQSKRKKKHCAQKQSAPSAGHKG